MARPAILTKERLLHAHGEQIDALLGGDVAGFVKACGGRKIVIRDIQDRMRQGETLAEAAWMKTGQEELSLFACNLPIPRASDGKIIWCCPTQARLIPNMNIDPPTDWMPDRKLLQQFSDVQFEVLFPGEEKPNLSSPKFKLPPL